MSRGLGKGLRLSGPRRFNPFPPSRCPSPDRNVGSWALVEVVQSVERRIPNPENEGSNPSRGPVKEPGKNQNMNADLSIGSLFSGIGGLELGLERAGLGPVLWQAECAPYPRRVLAKQWPEVKRYEQVQDVNENAARVGVLCGGFPCQDISQAGRKAGLSGKKSGLWSEFERAIGDLRPRWVVIENNGHRWRAWVPAVRLALHRLGYPSMCFRLRASEVGAWHQRSRAFVVANSDGVLIREQSRGRTGEHWKDALLAARAGAPWAPADPDPVRELQPTWRIEELRGRPGDGRREPLEPRVARGLHGVSHRLDRSRGLGNAVVPQVAEVVGGFIMRCEAGE